jgi:outer membrane protein assembly factor BamD
VLAPDVEKQNKSMFFEAVNQGRPAAPATAVTPTGPNEPPRSDRPSNVPLQMQAPAGGTGVGVEIVNAPNSSAPAPSGVAPADPNAVIKPVVPANNALPAPEAAAEAPVQVNDIKSGQNQPSPAVTTGKPKKPKVDQSDESSSKKKKKKGLAKVNPF